ncbi:MAG TPA: substrate-binding domain-containing protein [Thermosynechococcaceae cyanobacterium]
MKSSKSQLNRRSFLSLGILAAAVGLAYAPIPGLQQSIVIVSGTELQEPLQALESKFKQTHPNINLTLKFQGSQDMVNQFLDDRADPKPTVLIPANGQFLSDLQTRWKNQNQGEAFYEAPRSIAKTQLVGIAWSDRGKVLFPDGKFRWERVEQAMQAGNWAKIGGSSNWGSFDFVTTDPDRSNSGQLTLSLWLQSKLGGNLSSAGLNDPNAQALFKLVKKSVYEPPRSTDIMLREFIARGPNDADVGVAYESSALFRWQQSATNQGKPYQIYYLNPTIETTSTAAIVRRNVDQGTANAAKQFLDFLSQPEQQAVFVQHGFRPINSAVDLQAVPNSPWKQNIPGAEVKPTTQAVPNPDAPILDEIRRQWGRS